MFIDYDDNGWRAKVMRTVAFHNRMTNLSDNMQKILDDILELSKDGEFRLVVDYRLERKDKELLEMLGYDVFTSSEKETGKDEIVETTILWGIY